jgi:putative glutamine amidotransferase
MEGKHLIASRHHQAIDRLADGLEVVAEAPDGIIEAVVGHGHFGMQWHPESDATGMHVYKAFVDHCLAQNNEN